jgi:hypothetical protein
MIKADLIKGVPGEQWQLFLCGQSMGIGHWTLEEIPSVVATCMASMPSLDANEQTILQK